MNDYERKMAVRQELLELVPGYDGGTTGHMPVLTLEQWEFLAGLASSYLQFTVERESDQQVLGRFPDVLEASAFVTTLPGWRDDLYGIYPATERRHPT